MSLQAQAQRSARYSPQETVKIYTDWANHYLERGGCKRRVTDLQADLCDGVLLADLVEAVTNQKVIDVNRKPKSAQQMSGDVSGMIHSSSIFVWMANVTRITLYYETAMGTPLEQMTEFHVKYRKTVHEMGELIVHRFLSPWLHNFFLFNLSPSGRKQNKALEIIHGFSTKIIRERQQYHEDTGGMYLNNGAHSAIYSESKEQLAMLDLLIAAMKKGDINEAGIREEVDTFMFEGHDTSAMGICFALLLLAEHKDMQQRARDEIDAVLDKSGGKMTIAEIQQFKYLDRCIKESLRMYPSVPIISRYIGEELPLKKYVIPKGSMAAVPIYHLHRDPNFWSDPHTFDPDRFLIERSVGRHPFSYIPFSAGPRNCIGQKFAILELKALLAHLLHSFYLEPIDLASKVRLIPNMVISPIHPIRVRFVPR